MNRHFQKAVTFILTLTHAHYSKDVLLLRLFFNSFFFFCLLSMRRRGQSEAALTLSYVLMGHVCVHAAVTLSTTKADKVL